MRAGYSIRARLLLGSALVLLAFLTGAGLAVQRANAESVRAAYFGRLQSTIYLLLAAAQEGLGSSLALRHPDHPPTTQKQSEFNPSALKLRLCHRKLWKPLMSLR